MRSKGRAEARLLVDTVRVRNAQRAGRGSASTAFVNSLPKAGTHLLIKLMRSLPGLYGVRLHLGRDQARVFRPRREEAAILAGIASPEPMSLRRLDRAIERLAPGAFFTGHMPHSRELAALLSDRRVKTVLIVRDPRDVVVSSAAYLASTSSHHLSSRFAELDEEQRIMASITGLPGGNGQAGLRGIGDRVRSVLPWMTEPSVYVTTFERLVGPGGGGSHETQVEEVRRIAMHLDVPLGEKDAAHLASGLFGGTGTFRKGQIGGWRQVLTAKHIEALKADIDDLLIELGYETSTAWGLNR